MKSIKSILWIVRQASLCCILSLYYIAPCLGQSKARKELEQVFENPPQAALPGVYWYFMDGNISKDGMTKDLESMKNVGIGHLIYLEVNVGIPRGKVDFLSEEWKNLFVHAVRESERLGIDITLGVGPGWTGSGGPWVLPEESMQHLVSSSVDVEGGSRMSINLEKPLPRKPYFGEWAFTPELKQQWMDFYQDVTVLAFPTLSGQERIDEIDEKALVYRAPYSSAKNVKPFLPMSANYSNPSTESIVKSSQIIDITSLLKPDGTLEWDAPKGKWTIMRFGARNNGAVTRPAPLPGVGFETDKFDTIALGNHLDKFTGELFRKIGFPKKKSSIGGLKMLHMDSWEMGAQNWTKNFREEFTKRRGYDPFPFYPVYAGVMVESKEVSERFLWDLRLTSQELILENHAGYLKKYAHKYQLGLSIEPYDMNPTADLELGAIADVPMCEFWSSEFGFNTSYSAIEGSSLAHLKGQPVVPAEAFTAQGDKYAQYPGLMKNQTDWAFAAGINRLVYHTFQHQPLDDKLRPGMTMGPYGVHWDRNQTWWTMSNAYHTYVARCQAMLQMGRTVADILYLAPEGAPHVFRAPISALEGDKPQMLDKKGYNFDACPPSLLYQATVKNHCVTFPSGAAYRLLVLPSFETMTPSLLRKIKDLIQEGAIVVGVPPQKSPSLMEYPSCDKEIQDLVKAIWGGYKLPENQTSKSVGDGKIIWNKAMADEADNLYPSYNLTARILEKMNIIDDFKSDGPIRYTHRTMDECDIYFVSNRSEKSITSDCWFRVTGKAPEVWDALSGEKRNLLEFSSTDRQTKISLKFEAHQSYFIVFRKSIAKKTTGVNFKDRKTIQVLGSPWKVYFNPNWGGVKETTFNQLTDWSLNDDPGIKYYSGSAFYEQTFNLDTIPHKRLFLNLGRVEKMARVWLNGKDLGVLWTHPWSVDISKVVRKKNNRLKVEVVNLWINRLIGDENFPDERYTFTTYKHYSKDSPLSTSGLLGPVSIQREE